MTDRPDVTTIITAHREGLMAGPAARSLQAAVSKAAEVGIRCETVVVLDRSDSLTRDVLHEALGLDTTFVESDAGDPAHARNRGVAAAHGDYTCFLDADDLWSVNWVSEAYAAAQKRPDAVHHSHCNMVFGRHRLLFWHIDSESASCDFSYLGWNNYWDSLCFAKTQILRDYPFRPNDLTLGFGHEDWHWNTVTISEGIAHKPVRGTMHFKRARFGSQMSKVDSVGGIRWPIGNGELLRVRD